MYADNFTKNISFAGNIQQLLYKMDIPKDYFIIIINTLNILIIKYCFIFCILKIFFSSQYRKYRNKGCDTYLFIYCFWCAINLSAVLIWKLSLLKICKKYKKKFSVWCCFSQISVTPENKNYQISATFLELIWKQYFL